MLVNILVTVLVFIFMEFFAWFAHKYIMHGFLWSLHKDHHQVNHDHKFQKNDYFFLIFAIPSIILFVLGSKDFNYMFFSGLGIALYGLAYFIIHEIIIHRRLPHRVKLKASISKQLERLIKFIIKIGIKITVLILEC